MEKTTVTASFYDSAYPGSMCMREDGGYVGREDGESMVAALLEIMRLQKLSMEEWRNAVLESERKSAAIVKWLELNQPDVFSRGLWDAINGRGT